MSVFEMEKKQQKIIILHAFASFQWFSVNVFIFQERKEEEEAGTVPLISLLVAMWPLPPALLVCSSFRSKSGTTEKNQPAHIDLPSSRQDRTEKKDNMKNDTEKKTQTK